MIESLHLTIKVF